MNPINRPSFGTRKTRQPNSSPAAAKMMKIITQKNDGMNEMENACCHADLICKIPWQILIFISL